MKKMIVMLSVIVAGISAQASLPSLAEIGRAELAYVKSYKAVLNRVAALNASAFSASETSNNVYTIITNNGCSFNARLAYGEFGFNPNRADKGIEAIYLSKAVCK